MPYKILYDNRGRQTVNKYRNKQVQKVGPDCNKHDKENVQGHGSAASQKA